MQHRMKTHPLTKAQMEALLSRSLTGSLATLNEDGSPYVTPVHFVYNDGTVYLHGLPKGRKLDNIKSDPRVSMTVFEMDSLLLDPDEKPCDTNTKYESIILSGKAILVDDLEGKSKILGKIVKKYTPQLADRELPENMVRGTAVIRIDVDDMTGKFYDN